MKLLKSIFFSAALVCIFSCTKEAAGPYSTSGDIHSAGIGGCSHSNIIHHPAVAATAQTRGNVEYWSCPDCGKRFCDAAAKEEYTGRIYILPTKYVDFSCMAGYNPFPQGTGTKVAMEAASILAIGELLLSIGNLAAACVSYSDDCEDVINDIRQVTQKEKKSADDLEQLEFQLKEITEQVKSFNTEMDKMQAEVEEMIQNVNKASEILKKTRETLVKSLEAASQVDEKIRLHNLFDTRYKDITALDASTSCAWTAIGELLGKGKDLLPEAKTALDSADVLISKTRQVEAVISAWGSDWSYPSQTASLLERFNRMDADYGSTYVKLLDEYAADHFVWEHQAAAFKMLMLHYDFTVLAQAFALSVAYYKTYPGLEEIYLFNRISSMESDFDTMTTLAAGKTDEYQKIYTEDDRVCNATGKTFSVDAKEILPETFFVSLGDDCKSFLSFGIPDRFWSLYSLADTKEETKEKAVDDYDLELFCTGTNNTSLWDICFNSDAGGMGFHKSFSSDLPAAIMVPFGQNEYRTQVVYNSLICQQVKVWSNCRIDNMQPKEIYLGDYLGESVAGGYCKEPPEEYRYFTFEVTDKKESGQ